LSGQKKIYWHDSFFEGLQLEFHEYGSVLTFENERLLSEQALRIDVVVIKKEKDIRINKDIGRIFRGYNLFEYKPEKDSLSVNDYNKVIGYAYLYSSFSKVPLSDITVTFSLTVFPRELVKYLRNETRQNVTSAGDGIYYVDGEKFPVQILRSGKLAKEHLFLRNLRRGLSAEEALEVYKACESVGVSDKRNVYLDRLIQANHIAFREAMRMSETLKELFLEIAEEDEWLGQRINEKVVRMAEERAEKMAEEWAIKERTKVAKKMLSVGRPIDEVVDLTELPYETVAALG
jgi:hypothetical protein